MPRRREVVKRKILPDPKFQDRVVAKFVNNLMRKGKKSTGERIIYGAFDQVESKLKDDPLAILKQAMNNVKPVLEVKSRRVGGANYQVPVEVRPDRRNALATRWIITFAAARADHSFSEKFAQEIMAASRNEGGAVKKREDTHKMAEANKAFAHYRW
jgi:small subunit ribosomal protein S7